MFRTSSWFVGLESDLLVVDWACFCCQTLGAALEKVKVTESERFGFILHMRRHDFFTI
jgi:hypothetical protein